MNTIPVIEMQRLFARSEELCRGASDPANPQQSELRDLLRRTKGLAAGVMRDNEQLRVRNLLLERQKLEAEQRLDHDRLGKENEHLKAELELLERRLRETEKKARDYRRRQEETEHFNAAISQIQLATRRLHATRDFSEAVSVACEIIMRVAASSAFAIFLRDERTRELMLVGGIGVEGRFPGENLPLAVGLVAEAIATGSSLFADGKTSGNPLACLPLFVGDGEVLGLITIYEIEERKGQFSELDKEMFDLLAGHLASALINARAHTETLKKLESMESFIKLIKPV